MGHRAQEGSAGDGAAGFVKGGRLGLARRHSFVYLSGPRRPIVIALSRFVFDSSADWQSNRESARKVVLTWSRRRVCEAMRRL